MIAEYNGQEIDLSEGWQGAVVCSELADGDVRCYNSVEESNADLVAEGLATFADDTADETGVSPLASADCPWGWVCLWELNYYGGHGRLLRWSQSGTKNLSDWDFRDRASAACIKRNQGGVRVNDFRTLQPDPALYLAAGYCYPDFASIDYAYGGSWDNKADSIVM